MDAALTMQLLKHVSGLPGAVATSGTTTPTWRVMCTRPARHLVRGPGRRNPAVNLAKVNFTRGVLRPGRRGVGTPRGGAGDR